MEYLLFRCMLCSLWAELNARQWVDFDGRTPVSTQLDALFACPYATLPFFTCLPGLGLRRGHRCTGCIITSTIMSRTVAQVFECVPSSCMAA
ncbi:hypothetical protein IF2G_02425 [Cordyceps javanica]|nr:hypothetical protein IF2G_02425 [Cordyceps javanica]